MKSKEILDVVHMSKLYGVLPNTLLGIQDEYASYCFNEACTYVLSNIENNKRPRFAEDVPKLQSSNMSRLEKFVNKK